MRPATIRWLKGELPLLAEQGLLSAEQAQRILEHYERSRPQRRNAALVAFSIIGSVLCAAGIVLILAHNWSDLPRWARALLSFLPLLGSQAGCFWVLRRRAGSVPWSEGVSAFTFLAIGASIALVSQTYHVYGDLRTFLLTWLLLGLPLLYVFRSTTAGVFYMATVGSWALAERVAEGSAQWFWILLALAVPLYLMRLREDVTGRPAAVLGWFLSLGAVAGAFWAVSPITEGYLVITLVSLFVVLLALGTCVFPESDSIWKVPFYRVGILGLAVVYLVLSYRNVWGHLSFEPVGSESWWGGPPGPADYAVSLLWPAAAVVAGALAAKARPWPTLYFALGLPLTALGFALSGSSGGQGAATVVLNLYVLAGGVLYLLSGIRRNSGRDMNFGFALVAAVVLLRFFDADLSFVARGVVFVLLGLGFLGANVVVARRKAR